MSLTGDKCEEACKENEEPDTNKVCVCDELSIIHEDGTHCVKRTECQRTFSKNGVSVCLAAEVCKGDLKLSLNDEHLCVSDCDLWTEDEQTKELRCVAECPEGSRTDGGKLCKTCAMRNEDTPYWNGKDCVAGCGDYQVSDVDKKCICKSGLVKSADYAKCAPPADKTWRDFADICVEYLTVASLTGDRCAEACGEDEVVQDNKLCVCDAEHLLHEDETHCVWKSECQRATEKDGTTTCLSSETCPEGTKLSTDGQTCITECDLWTEDAQSGELRCVESCPDWWYSSEGGLCVEEKWRKSTAIAVPVVVIVVAVGVVLAIVIVRKKTKAKNVEKKEKSEEQMRDNVTNA